MDSLKNLATSPTLLAALKNATNHTMSPAEQHAQRRSWVIGQMMCSHPEMTREEAERLADKAIGPNLAARVAELEAENARLAEQLADATRDLLAADEENEALEEKLRSLAPHGSCACSYDRPGEVCMHHSPKLATAEAENTRLRIALHDAIRRPLGVTPDSALEFYSPRMADEAEERRPRLSDRLRHTVPVGIAIDADHSRPPIPVGKARIANVRRARPAPGTREEG